MARMFYDEMHDAGGECRSHYREFARWLADTPEEQLLQRGAKPTCCSIAPASPSPCMATSRAPSA